MQREEAHDGGQAKRQRMELARWLDNPLSALNLGGSQVKLEAAKGGKVNTSDSFSGSGKEQTWLPAGPPTASGLSRRASRDQSGVAHRRSWRGFGRSCSRLQGRSIAGGRAHKLHDAMPAKYR